jgi:hypothetical protein
MVITSPVPESPPNLLSPNLRVSLLGCTTTSPVPESPESPNLPNLLPESPPGPRFSPASPSGIFEGPEVTQAVGVSGEPGDGEPGVTQIHRHTGDSRYSWTYREIHGFHNPQQRPQQKSQMLFPGFRAGLLAGRGWLACFFLGWNPSQQCLWHRSSIA